MNELITKQETGRMISIFYRCGEKQGETFFPHSEVLILSASLSSKEIASLVQCYRQQLCPRCLLEQRYQQAAQQAQQWGLKQLRGEEKHVLYGEYVRSEAVKLFRQKDHLRWFRIFHLLNLPENLQAQLWVNFREVVFADPERSEQKRVELWSFLLQAKPQEKRSSSPKPEQATEVKTKKIPPITDRKG